MPDGNSVGNDVWGFLAAVTTAGIAGLVQVVRGWKGGESSTEPTKGGKAQEDPYRKVYIESAELADLNSLRALHPRLDKILEKLEDNRLLMKSVEAIVGSNHSIMTTVEAVVKQNNQILAVSHEILDKLTNAEKVQEQVRLKLLERQLLDRDERDRNDRRNKTTD